MAESLQQAPSGLAAIQVPVSDGLDQVLEELKRIVVSDFDMIEEVNEYLLLMRGKLFRPTLLLLAAQVAGEPAEDAVTLASVVELVHLATLVHDDAVDHSVLRRGRPTVNALWTHQIAIIMGDYLYSRAVTELTRLSRLEALRVLATAANEMSVGEMRQLTSYEALGFSEADYFRLIRSKTASLMAGACEMGALAGVDVSIREPLRLYGQDLGMAFQIADDLLDYTGSEANTGKPTGHDLRERKVTLPLVGALKRADDRQLGQVKELFANPNPSDAEIQSVIDLVGELGGLEYAQAKAEEYGRSAIAHLESVGSENPSLDALRSAVAYTIDRRR